MDMIRTEFDTSGFTLVSRARKLNQTPTDRAL